MAFSYNEVGAISPGDTISVPFGFLDRSHISVDVDGVVVGNWEWINNGLIKASSGFPIGTKTKVYRTTPLTALPSTLQGASVFDWEGVNLNDLQALFVLQEYVDKEEERNAAIEFVKGLAEALDASMEDLAETILPALSLKADKESPALTGSPTTPTPATDAPDFVIANMEAVRRAFNAITKTSLGLGSVDNVSAANLRDRTTHTGQQAMGTVSGLVDALALKASHTDVAEAVAGVVNSSPAALDTLRELATALGDDPNFSATVSTALGNRLRVDLAQSLTTTQKNQAAANLGIAPGATANATDAALRARSSHTGTQSADTITDSATKVVMTSTERAKLAAVAEGATANDSDANLKNRANHTGTQGVDTISGIGEWVEDRVAGLIKAGPNITVTYNDAGNELTIGASGSVSTSAAATTFTPAGGIASTNVQAALQEVDTSNIRDRGTLASGADLDTVTSPGTYQVSGNALAASLVNSPSTQAGQLLVYYSGASVQVTQQYIVWGGAAGGGRIFTRTKHGTLGWSAWFGTALQSELDGKLDKTGGVLTGATTVRSSTATLQLDSTVVGNSNLIWGRKNNVARWALIPGNSAPEPGDDSGSDFALHRYNDAGAFLDVAFRVDRKNGFTTSANGHKWVKCIDISGTGLNSLVEGGKYNGNNLTDTPFVDASLWWFVEVDRYSAGSGTAIQRAMILSGLSKPAEWVRRRTGAGTWGPWVPLGLEVSPAHFGGTPYNHPTASGIASTDDTLPVQRWLDSPWPKKLDGWYRITEAVTKAVSTAEQGLFISGAGATSGIRCDKPAGKGGGRIVITGADVSNPTGTTFNQVTLRDLFVGINYAAAADIMLIAFADGDSGSAMPSLHMSNVHFIPFNTACGVENGYSVLHLNDVRQGHLENVSGFGKYGGYLGNFIRCTQAAGGATVEMTFTNVRCAHFQTGFKLEAADGNTQYDDSQGYHFVSCAFLAVDRGWDMNGGPEGFGEWFTWSKCHAYMREVGILGTNIGNVRAENCYFLGHGSLSTIQGIALTGTSIELYNWLSKNRVRLDAATGGTRIGINVPSSLTGVADYNYVTGATTQYIIPSPWGSVGNY